MSVHDLRSHGVSDVSPAVLTRDLTDAPSWAYTTRTFRALDYSFAVRTTHAGIGAYIDEMYGPCATNGEPTNWFSLLDGLRGTWSHALYSDDECLTESDRGAYVLNRLAWHVNRRVIAASGEYVLLHAAAASYDGKGILLPAAMEAGKTTLVAGLVRAGFGYLTDEAAAVDPHSLRLQPFPKPLTIDQGSWVVLADFEPPVDPSTMEYLSEQWHVSPQVIHGEDVISEAVPVKLVVFPRYVAGAATELEPLRRSDALVALLGQTFRFHENGPRNLDVLGRLLDGIPCYRLVAGDLDEAVAGVQDLVAREIRSRPPESER